MTKKIIFMAFALAITLSAQQQNRHALFTEVLNDYVKDGLVDYDAMKGDGRLERYLQQLYETDPDSLTEDEQLAFWINAYNAFTLHVILLEYPVESINDLHTGGLIIGQVLGQTIWHDERFEINGKKYSLNNIEHDIIREDFDEPRIHFALVCAAISCPPLRYEAYESYKLDEQLQNQSVKFFNNTNLNVFNIKERIANLSKIMDWYYDDFADNDKDLLLYCAQFLNGETAEDIKANAGEWDIEYLEYNWSLNEYEGTE